MKKALFLIIIICLLSMAASQATSNLKAIKPKLGRAIDLGLHFAGIALAEVFSKTLNNK